MVNRGIFLDIACGVGARISREAGSRTRRFPWGTDPTVYKGAAGIALFLLRLYNATGHNEFCRAAETAVRDALERADSLTRSAFGFYNGRVGIAYAAMELGRITAQQRWRRQGERLLARLQGLEQQDYGIDVIGGAAGAIPALVELTRETRQEWILELARRLGDHLINVASKEPSGWGWPVLRPSQGGIPAPVVRHLTGLAHGAAGIGHGLLCLYKMTADRRYLYAAEQAFLYERQFFVANASNWLDLRRMDIGKYLYERRLGDLRRLVAATPSLGRYRPTFMTAWCHGAAGIGLTRLHAYRILRRQSYKAEACAAVLAIERWLRSFATRGSKDYSLCHGTGGACETLLYASQVFRDASLRKAAEQWGLRGWRVWQKAGGHSTRLKKSLSVDSSLLMGEAGVGYYFLRLAVPTVPSVLLLATHSFVSEAPTSQSGHFQMRNRVVQSYFNRIITVLGRLHPRCAEGPWMKGNQGTHAKLDVVNAYEWIVSQVRRRHKSCERQLLHDAFRVERERYRMALAPVDFTEVSVRRRLQSPLPGPWESFVVTLAPHARLVRTRRDWDAWLASGDKAIPPRATTFHLVYQLDATINAHRITRLGATVLGMAGRSISVARLFRSIGATVVGSRLAVRRAVIEQLRAAYRAGLLLVRNNWQRCEKLSLLAQGDPSFRLNRQVSEKRRTRSKARPIRSHREVLQQ